VEYKVKINYFNGTIPFKEAYKGFFREFKADVLDQVVKIFSIENPEIFLAQHLEAKQTHLNQFFLGQKKLSTDKLIKLCQALDIKNEFRRNFLNINTVIELYQNKNHDLIKEILPREDEFISEHQLHNIKKFVDTKNIGKFLAALKLPKLEGHLSKIAEFASIDEKEAIDISKALSEIGIVEENNGTIKLKDEKFEAKATLESKEAISSLSDTCDMILKGENRSKSTRVKNKYIQTTKEKYQNYLKNNQHLWQEIYSNLYDPNGDEVVCINSLKYLIESKKDSKAPSND